MRVTRSQPGGDTDTNAWLGATLFSKTVSPGHHARITTAQPQKLPREGAIAAAQPHASTAASFCTTTDSAAQNSPGHVQLDTNIPGLSAVQYHQQQSHGSVPQSDWVHRSPLRPM
jgi:hypothetical protein